MLRRRSNGSYDKSPNALVKSHDLSPLDNGNTNSSTKSFYSNHTPTSQDSTDDILTKGIELSTPNSIQLENQNVKKNYNSFTPIQDYDDCDDDQSNDFDLHDNNIKGINRNNNVQDSESSSFAKLQRTPIYPTLKSLIDIEGDELTSQLRDSISLMYEDSERHREKARIFADERDKLLVEKEQDVEKIFELTSTVAYLTSQLQSKNSRISELEQKQWQEASLHDGPDPQELVAAHELNGRLQLQIIDLDDELKSLEKDIEEVRENEKVNVQREISMADEAKKLHVTIAELTSEIEELKKGKLVAENSANAWHGHAQLQAKSALAWEAEAKSFEARITELQDRLDTVNQKEEYLQKQFESKIDLLSKLMSKRLQNRQTVHFFYEWKVKVEKKRVETVQLENRKLVDKLEASHNLLVNEKSTRRPPRVHAAPLNDAISLWSLFKISLLLFIFWIFLVTVGLEHFMRCRSQEIFRLTS